MNSRIALWLGLSVACVSGIGAAQAEGADGSTAPPADAQPYFFWADNSLTLLPYGRGFVVDPARDRSRRAGRRLAGDRDGPG